MATYIIVIKNKTNPDRPRLIAIPVCGCYDKTTEIAQAIYAEEIGKMTKDTTEIQLWRNDHMLTSYLP